MLTLLNISSNFLDLLAATSGLLWEMLYQRVIKNARQLKGHQDAVVTVTSADVS